MEEQLLKALELISIQANHLQEHAEAINQLQRMIVLFDDRIKELEADK